MKAKHPALWAVAVAAAALVTGCGERAPDVSQAADSAQLRARSLAAELLVLDSHIDLPYRLIDEPLEAALRSDQGHFDYQRARAGGLDAAFMAVYVSPYLEGPEEKRRRADQLIDLVECLAERWPDRFALARSPEEVREARARGLIALPLGMENGAPITDVEALEHFHRRGVRYVTLTHSENNPICDSSYAEDRRWQGLSPWGKELVPEMNRLGMMIDVSHATDQATEQVLDLSSAPVIASHSCCRHFTPGFERNLSDDLIRRIAEGGGVVQIAFASGFLTAAAQQQSSAAWEHVDRYLAEHGLGWESPEVDEQRDLYWAEHPPIPTHVSDVADHVDHVVSLVGVDHVGIGSDFDGFTNGPVGLEDASAYPNLIAELLRRGYSEDDLRKICSENLFRVWTTVEGLAAEQGSAARAAGH